MAGRFGWIWLTTGPGSVAELTEGGWTGATTGHSEWRQEVAA